MPEIRILPEIISNKIAAGEVVERPVSVVKELVENALDADARHIVIEIEKGGRDLIRVSDNGHGMSRDNALLAIERYATSKIEDDEDLFSIQTFGFRGEALPSMASVSKFTLVSCKKGSESAAKIEIHGGRLMDVSETGAPEGTMVEVKNLYFNTPARRKFLKSVNTEMGHIADSVSAIALSFPEVSFRLIHNGRMVKHFTESDGLLARVGMVLGSDNLEKLFPVGSKEGKEKEEKERKREKEERGEKERKREKEERGEGKEGLQVSGYVGTPSLTRSSGARIILFVNKRVVTDRALVSAIVRGYKGRIMKGKFPVAAIFLKIPFDEVDVNVHPAKLQVRFVNQGFVFGAVFNAVHQALSHGEQQQYARQQSSLNQKNPEQYHSEDDTLPELSEFDPPVDYLKKKSDGFEPKAEGSDFSTEFSSFSTEFSDFHMNVDPAYVDPETVSEHFFENETSKKSLSEKSLVEQNIKEGPEEQGEKIKQGEEEIKKGAEAKKDAEVKKDAEILERKPFFSTKSFFSSLSVVGQVFNTYIIAESKEEMILIDQHAAHERVVYEKLKSRSTLFRPPSQSLIVPEVIEASYREADLIERISPHLLNLGIEIENFGDRTFIIKSVPAIIDDREIKSMVMDILDALMSAGAEDCVELNPVDLKGEKAGEDASGSDAAGEREWLDSILILMACHNAVRANHRLNQREIKELLSDLDQCGTPFYCPHGRPTLIRWEEKELGKLFKRTL